MDISGKAAIGLHKDVPPGWYFNSIRKNIFQRYWHRRRFDEISKLIDPAKKVLDVGCADGLFTNLISEITKAKEIVAIDVVEGNLKWAKKHWKKNNIKFALADAHKLPFKANSFDAVFILEVLEHVVDPEKVLLEIKRVLKRGGYVIVLVPTDNFLFRIIWFLWKFSGRMVWENTHIQSFKGDSLANLVKSTGFTALENKRFLLGMLQAIKIKK